MSGLIPQAAIEEVLQRINIVELIDQFVPLKKQGNNFTACCPFHNEKTPSFSVNQQKQFYHCFGCGVGGNAINFLMQYNHFHFVEAVEWLAEKVGFELPKTTENVSDNQPRRTQLALLKNISQFYQQCLKQTPDAIEYLQSRGLTGEIAKQFQIGFAPPGWNNLQKQFPGRDNQQQLIQTGMLIHKDNGNTYDRYRNRIMFPIINRKGDVIGFGGRVIDANDNPKYLNSPETPIFHKSRELYGFYHTLNAQSQLSQVVIVEGYLDVIALFQHDVPYAVATMGTATTKDHIHQLTRYCKHLIFCFDGDKAGHDAAWRALQTCLPLLRDGLQIHFLFLPNGEDPDSIIKKEGKTAFMQRLQQAYSLSDYLFKKVSHRLDLSTVAGKTQLIEAIKPLLKQIPPGAYYELLIQAISQATRLDAMRINGMLETQAQKTQSKTTKSLTPIKKAIAIILQQPQILKKIANLKKPSMLQGNDGEVLIELLSVLMSNPDLSTAALVEKWRDTNTFQLLNELATWDLAIPESGMAAELQAIFCMFNDQQTQQVVTQLLQKANQQGLSSDERAKLQALIKQSKQREEN